MIRASLARALLVSAALAGALLLAGCFAEEGYELPTRAMKQLSPQTVALLKAKNMPEDSPILIRLFKEESELEVWKKDTSGRFQLFKIYPICRWSGDLGPKIHEGDRQAPEGFYTITPNLMNPDSNYYLAINTGFPNAYDRANNRHGAFLMIHGDCSSRGCYAMTDEQIGEIYSLAHNALLGGQQSFQIEAFPFRMTPYNLAHHRTNPSMPFWRMIKVGYDHFEVSHQEPKVEVCDRRYVFDPVPPPNSRKPLVFNPTGRCPAYVVNPEIAGSTMAKERADAQQFAELARSTPAAPITTGLDGGANRVFLAQMGRIPPARVVPPEIATGTVVAADLPPQPPQPSGGSWLGGLFGSSHVATADAQTEHADGSGGGFFSHLFSSNGTSAPQPTSDTALRGSEPQAATRTAEKQKVDHNRIASTRARSKSEGEKAQAERREAKKTEHGKIEPKLAAQKSDTPRAEPAKPPPAQQATNAATPPAATNGAINGAQPVVSSGNFDSRWAAVH